MKRFNVNEFLWFIILLGFTLYFYYLLSSGRIIMFISPRLIKYVIFSLVGFGILTLYQFTKVFTIRSRRPVNKSYMLLFVTLVIGCLAAQNGLNSNIIEKKGLELAAINDKNETRNIDDKIMKSTKNMQQNSKSENLHAEETIEFNNENYSEKLADIEANFEKYKGRKVVVSGFVYKDKNFNKDEFVPARFYMSCCAADSLVIGLMSKWDGAENLRKDEWVKVEGRITSSKYHEAQTGKEIKIPIIQVDKVDKIQKPDEEYIYP